MNPVGRPLPQKTARERRISRRRLMGFVGGYLGASALGMAVAPKVEAKQPPEGAIAMLYDTTRCIGCKACVYECRRVNGLDADTEMSGGMWQMPLDLNARTKNLIKLYEADDGSEWSFFKHQCMHCVDPSCVDGCPFHALEKDPERGIVTWTGNRCIGCRYCEVSCPYRVPKFEWFAKNPKIVKCEFCRHVLGKEGPDGIDQPGCTKVCPTGAVIFGTREELLAEAKSRLAESPDAYAEDRVFGEKDGGGTQVFYLSHVPFEKLGLPVLREESIGQYSKKVHRFFTQWLVFPLALWAAFTVLIRQNWKDHEKDVVHMHERSGLKEQL